jgi:arylsulfatase A-like enzyme
LWWRRSAPESGEPNKPVFPGFLPEEYVSTAIGKWHLGLDEDYPELKWHAVNRGFDECYRFMGRGGHSYFNLRSDTDGKFAGAIYRNKERVILMAMLKHLDDGVGDVVGKWIAPMAEPITAGPKRTDNDAKTTSQSVGTELSEREKERQRTRAEKKKKRTEEKKAEKRKSY